MNNNHEPYEENCTFIWHCSAYLQKQQKMKAGITILNFW